LAPPLSPTSSPPFPILVFIPFCPFVFTFYPRFTLFLVLSPITHDFTPPFPKSCAVWVVAFIPNFSFFFCKIRCFCLFFGSPGLPTQPSPATVAPPVVFCFSWRGIENWFSTPSFFFFFFGRGALRTGWEELESFPPHDFFFFWSPPLRLLRTPLFFFFLGGIFFFAFSVLYHWVGWRFTMNFRRCLFMAGLFFLFERSNPLFEAGFSSR